MAHLDVTLTGKLPVLEPVHGPRPERCAPDLVRRLGRHTVADLSDLVGRLHTMTSEIRPLYEGCPRLVGTAVTVRTPRGDNRAVREAVDHIEDGDVLVVDAQGFTGWCSGGYGMLHPVTSPRTLAGLVVNGAYRDIDDFRRAALPLYGIAPSPATGPKLGPGDINVPASCGNVVVHPGDVIVADAEGAVVIPRAQAGAVARHADARGAGLTAADRLEISTLPQLTHL
ncbi:RraA family protein [Streptomyces sp. NRRL F-5126]|uniref:RraA family protein n=1 Tax=Streptomyces sp. NRRL F-5126 TaxID=1463857 RepID=UPI00068B5425|nr:hypothetical protein [Streptomyces sp. NRRL F-5126]